MSLTRGKGLKQHDLTPFFRIPITVIRVDAVLLRDVKGCCCNAGGIGQGGTQIFAVADGCNVDGRKRQKLGQLAAHDFAPALKHDGKAAVCDGVFEKRRVRGGAQCAERLGEFFFRAHLQKHVDGAILTFPKLTGKRFSLCGKRGINRRFPGKAAVAGDFPRRKHAAKALPVPQTARRCTAQRPARAGRCPCTECACRSV